MTSRRAFRYRVYLTVEQVARMEAWLLALRWLWNHAHAEYVAKFEHGYWVPTAFDQINALTALRATVPWLAEVPRDVSAQLLVELDRAWARFFAGLADRPRFKSSKRGDSAPMIAPHYFRVEGSKRKGVLVFPKLGNARAIVHRPLQGKPKTCAIVREGDEWYCSISCEIEVPDPPTVNDKPAVGIDRGVVNLLADSNGRIVPGLHPMKNARAKLAKAQRRVARKKKGAKNMARANRRVARIHRHVSRQRDAVLHRESKHYAENQGVVVVEALRLKNMTASVKGTVESPGKNVAQKAGLNRALLDGGLGRFVQFLKYKSVPTGCRVVEADPAYSSQECSACGHVHADNRQSQSVFECVSCGHRENADTNAAKVILRRGTHGAEVCRGDGVARPEKQKLRVVRRGTRHVDPELSDKAPAFMPG